LLERTRRGAETRYYDSIRNARMRAHRARASVAGGGHMRADVVTIRK
jgi:hypothetical protein